MSLVCTRMSVVCTRMSSVCHSYILLCHPYVARMYSYVMRMWFYHEPQENANVKNKIKTNVHFENTHKVNEQKI